MAESLARAEAVKSFEIRWRACQDSPDRLRIAFFLGHFNCVPAYKRLKNLENICADSGSGSDL